jgi:hypothetical protein
VKIRVETPGGETIDIQVHSSGSATVHVDSTHAGQCRWEKDGNEIRLYDFPRNVFEVETERDDENGLRFEFEDRKL